MRARATGLALGFVADRVLGDPATGHPVAVFGRVALAVERRLWADDVGRGAVYTTTLVGATVLAAAAGVRLVRRAPVAETVVTAATTWTVLGGRSLGREAEAVRRHLAEDDLPAARTRLTHLVGRDTSVLDPTDVSRAVIESVAENTSDAVVAPLLAGAVAGLPGLVGYRAANTLDAMVGHRNERYRRFGSASARLDDLLNLVPARVTALLGALLAPTVHGSPGRAVEAWRRDARHHPSPNAGPVEAAFAGALDIQLGGVNTYGDRVEDRHTLGDGRPPRPDDIRRAVRLADRVDLAALGFAVLIVLRPRRRRPRAR